MPWSCQRTLILLRWLATIERNYCLLKNHRRIPKGLHVHAGNQAEGPTEKRKVRCQCENGLNGKQNPGQMDEPVIRRVGTVPFHRPRNVFLRPQRALALYFTPRSLSCNCHVLVSKETVSFAPALSSHGAVSYDHDTISHF